ncbi:hypothetical protein BV22DRAFT_305510 [Leucogyrophana mollusca]|uniref:Uncharacterized protein n=1 Tax=Leucogyrophana mollusca TaxID=85980 RepID=A0ACB8BMF9_9AGAM|nr:hypothetical protein BV22DRAFT_305510 [Leucogyrophana mollusca]
MYVRLLWQMKSVLSASILRLPACACSSAWIYGALYHRCHLGINTLEGFSNRDTRTLGRGITCLPRAITGKKASQMARLSLQGRRHP